MDMGDILNQWDEMKASNARKQRESGKNQVSHKKANAPTKEEKELARARQSERDFEAQMRADNSREVNPMEMWLRRYGTIDKDKLAEENEERTKMQDRSYLVNMKPEAIIDLHGLHQDEAEQRLNSFVGDCVRRGLSKILIIHGKGIHTTGTNPVLGKVVRSFIEHDKHCGMSGHPKTKSEGGSGATWVILKK